MHTLLFGDILIWLTGDMREGLNSCYRLIQLSLCYWTSVLVSCLARDRDVRCTDP